MEAIMSKCSVLYCFAHLFFTRILFPRKESATLLTSYVQKQALLKITKYFMLLKGMDRNPKCIFLKKVDVSVLHHTALPYCMRTIL